MDTSPYPPSPKLQIGGLVHLGRLFDKIRMRNAGQIQDYNYLTVGFDKQLLDRLDITGEDLEKRVMQGGADEEVVAWVQEYGKTLTDDEQTQWNDRILNGGPQHEVAQQRFQSRIGEVAAKRGLPVEQLSFLTRWVDIIGLDEGRM